jgi:putative tryptophan/tyrosine transport system substrate-binding protein
MPISRYIVVAVVRCSCASCRLPVVNRHADALVVGSDVFFTTPREQLVALAARHSVPTIERWREFAASGGLISYGPSLTAANHQVGIYAGKILKGTKPIDLPVVQSTKYELVVNLRTAKILGLTIPLEVRGFDGNDWPLPR